MQGKICPVCEKHFFKQDNYFEYCPVCGWQDDAVQRKNPDYSGGANVVSLNEYRKQWLEKDKSDKKHSVYLVYGSPLSGKTTFVRNNMVRGDIVVDMDRLFQAVTLGSLYDKPHELLANVISLRDRLIEDIKHHKNGWHSAWIIGGYPQKSEREKLIADLDAEAVFMDVSRELCMERLASCGDYRSEHFEEYSEYINTWFDSYTA